MLGIFRSLSGLDSGLVNAEFAVILAGGGSTRMGVDKAGLRLDGRTLLQRAVDACQSCRHVVVVAPAASVAGINSPGASFSVVLEDPPLGGPVAGIDAGLRALPEGDADATVLVLAVDLADPDAVVRTLTAGADTGGWVDGVALADDEGWPLMKIFMGSSSVALLSAASSYLPSLAGEGDALP